MGPEIAYKTYANKIFTSKSHMPLEARNPHNKIPQTVERVEKITDEEVHKKKLKSSEHKVLTFSIASLTLSGSGPELPMQVMHP